MAVNKLPVFFIRIGVLKMYNDKILSTHNLKNLNYEETKKNVNMYFKNLEILQWEVLKLNRQNGLTAKYDFSVEYEKQPYIPIGKDEFNLSAKESAEEQFKKFILAYYWAKSVLSDKEQLYITEYYINHKNENELLDLLGFDYIYNYNFRKLKRSAIYKFADFLNLVVEKN